MAKSKKKPRSSSKKKSSSAGIKRATTRKQQEKEVQYILARANAQKDPLIALPPSMLNVFLPPSSRNRDTENNGDATSASSSDDAKVENPNNELLASSTINIQHFSSPLPPDILEQCLELFENNMGRMYEESKWGLDMEGKLEELQHADARFLVAAVTVMSSVAAAADKEVGDAGDTVTKEANGDSVEAAAAAAADDCDTNRECSQHHNNNNNNNGKTINNSNSIMEQQQPQQCKVLGFAHFRYDEDETEDDTNNSTATVLQPVSYLYELQVRPAHQKLGLGKKLVTLAELIAVESRMKKVMLTVFRANEGAMGFYRKRMGYDVDACSPSNYFEEGGENGDYCDYEILSKVLG